MTDLYYKQLVEMDEQYKQKGLEILGFPCSQFGGQEFKESAKTIEFVKKYNVKFDMFEKIDVNGASTHPVYQYLKYHSVDFNSNAPKAEEEKTCDEGCKLASIGWNFGKFLVDGEGRVVKYGGPRVKPFDMRSSIEQLLSKGGPPTKTDKEKVEQDS
eukprot:GHVS01088460.1.p1 GENE.GHVS01088460.1~~GHVS01088460.1.p1  ORF type:complete len:157 (+),score=34.88 GHVS01088460.1:302-772(+)